ncbi:MAG: methylmalonyl-CoA mutase [Chlorobiaceae bacterium]|nr:methylmalonyl-CoA mutase [Chlorobiaceae bacterium]
MSQTESLFSHFPPIDETLWKKRVLEELKGAAYSKIVWKSPDGFAMEPWYNSHTALAAGEVPFGRSSNRWNICQQLAIRRLAADPELVREALTGGADAIEFLFDGRNTAVDTATLLERLQDIDLSRVPIFLSGHIDDPAALIGKLLCLPGFASNSGGVLCDTISAETWKTLAALTSRLNPEFRTMGIDTVRFHTAGATIVQELAFALSSISDHLASLTEAGIDAGEAAARISIVVASGPSHFPGLASLRALRAMWPQLLEAYGVTAEKQPEPHLFVRASLRSFSVLDPYTNLLRLSTEALSAILGGCDTLQLAPFDPAGSVPAAMAERITRNIQLLLREESNLDRVVDPASGSWYIETMTATLCHEAWTLFREIEAEGGLRCAEANGALAAMIAPVVDARQKAINTRRQTLVGINRYTVPPSAEVISNMNTGGGTGAVIRYEQLRLRMLSHTAAGGSTPRALFWLHGEPSKSLRIAAFAEEFLLSGGFEVLPGITVEPETRNCRAILQDEPDIVVLCWSGEADLACVPAICTTIQELRKDTVVIMASKPPENAAVLLHAGLDRFIYTGSDACADLLSLQHKTGVL